MKHTQKLEDWQLTFANPEEFCTSEDFDFEAGCFIEFVEDNEDDFTELEKALSWAVDQLVDVCEAYFKPIKQQEELDYRRELSRELATEWNH